MKSKRKINSYFRVINKIRNNFMCYKKSLKKITAEAVIYQIVIFSRLLVLYSNFPTRL